MEHQSESTPEEATSEQESFPNEPGKEKHATAAEISAAAILFAVMLGGILWSYYQGYQTGHMNGQDEAFEQYMQERIAEPAPAAVPSGQFFVDLKPGQSVSVTLNGPGSDTESRDVVAEEGDRVVISVESPGI